MERATNLSKILSNKMLATLVGTVKDLPVLPKTYFALRTKLQDPEVPMAELVAVAEPPRQELFRRINLAAGGTALVVEMRRDLLRMLPAHPELRPVDADMRHLLSSWFNRGFLRLERIG